MRTAGLVRIGFAALWGLTTSLAWGAGSLVAQAQPPGKVYWEARHQESGVGLSVYLPAGGSSDPAGAEGTAFLFGMTLQAEAGRILAPMGARLQVDVGLEHTSVTMFAPARQWAAAWREVAGLLSGTPLPDGAVRAAREQLLDQLMFEAGAPVRAFEIEWNRMRLDGLLPGGTNVARAVRGTLPGVGSATASSLEDWRRENIRWQEAVVAVVGPVSESEVRMGSGSVESLGGVVPVTRPDSPGARDPGPVTSDSLTREAAGAPLPPPPLRIGVPSARLELPSGGARHPWNRIERRVINQEITSTWIGMAWPIPGGTPLVLRDFLSHVLSDALNPTPPDPGLYRADVRLERLGGSSLLIVEATVDPQATLQWEARILETLAGVADAPTPGAFFELARRRYRTARLLEAADPAERARWIATRAAVEGRVPQVSPESWGLSREGLGALAGSLGDPRILIFGPERMMTPR
ncbi:hypothetical protein BH23GEM11_BH23GEM11_06520 [soil metagenome]